MRGKIPKHTPGRAGAASSSPSPLFDLAVRCFNQKDFEGAAKHCTALLANQPEHFNALHLLGVVSGRQNNPIKAVELISQAISLNPQNPAFHVNLGIWLKAVGKPEEAAASYLQATRLKPDHAKAHFNWAALMHEASRLDEAEAGYRRVLEIDPRYASAYYNLADIFQKRGALADARSAYEAAITLDPNMAQAHYNLANTLEKLGDAAQAMTHYDAAIAINPGYAQAYYNRGLLHQSHDRFEQAIGDYEKTISLRPNDFRAYVNRGAALKSCQLLDEAVASYLTALRVVPDDPTTLWNLSLLYLLQGDYERGWRMFESRWRVSGFPSERRVFSQPLWLGKEDLAGKTVLIYGEQGLGDTIQFCRYVPMVANLGARVILEVQKPLLTLLKDMAGISQIIARPGKLPHFDFQVPMMSLPLAFKSQVDTIPHPGPYLTCDLKKLQEWRVRLGEKRMPRVGIVWSGSTTHGNDKNRSARASDFIDLLPEGIEFFSLQKELRTEDASLVNGSNRLQHFGIQLLDFSDTAALCANMDLVISVDTSVAHLSGALGKPTWLVLPYAPDWRWLLRRDDTPWYSSMRLIRRQRDQDWRSLFIDVFKFKIAIKF